ncbi:MAG: hypothetical protein K9N47_19750 [Prosthecobacter sp.]|uniref:hypothetical protein n=1 Tax=Prosthecobacter sp. TaxID=1965333 RepID=UPI0025D9278F|nr:hypothetical protein [Prosthecobacter sp.]MCF7788366.1 hypothetical protein [Prosthecobacter sp.]
MRSTLLALLLSGCLALAGEPGAYTPQPNLVGQITSALVTSKLDHLTPHTYQDKGTKFSYNLQSVACLGTIERGNERFILATALFIRSSAENSEYPPPRHHGFLLCLSTDFHLISHCSLDFPNVKLNGTQLLRGDETIADFAASDPATRRRGFVIDRSHFLPYPFADRLPDPAATAPSKQP